MSPTSKSLLIGSMVVAGLVAVLAAIDMVLGFPFAKRVVMDIMLLLGAGLVLYLGIDSYLELK